MQKHEHAQNISAAKIDDLIKKLIVYVEGMQLHYREINRLCAYARFILERDGCFCLQSDKYTLPDLPEFPTCMNSVFVLDQAPQA